MLVLAQKNAAGRVVCRGEAEDHLSLFSGAHQPPPKEDSPALASGRRYAWTRTTPIGVHIVRQVEQLERRTLDRRVQDQQAPSECLQRARWPGGVWLLRFVVRRAMVVSKVFKADFRFTYQWDVVRGFY